MRYRLEIVDYDGSQVNKDSEDINEILTFAKMHQNKKYYSLSFTRKTKGIILYNMMFSECDISKYPNDFVSKRFVRSIELYIEQGDCCICGRPIVGYGNNPSPIMESGCCCDDCNKTLVIP